MVTTQVLMHAGPEGLTIAEVIEKANVLGLTDPAWEVTSSRKSSLSSVRADPCWQRAAPDLTQTMPVHALVSISQH